MSLVTVIIPAYNEEKYICKCLESVVHQNFADYDVMVVNDGSSDNTENIIKEYKNEYSFINYFNKENGGLSSARNYGIDRLKDSKYVVCSGQYRITEDGKIISHVRYILDGQGKCVLRHLNMHGKIYRVDYLKKYNLRFPEGKTYEDNPFNLAAFFLTDRINFLQYEGYYQLVHLDSITTCKIKQNEVPYSELEQSVQCVIAHGTNEDRKSVV